MTFEQRLIGVSRDVDERPPELLDSALLRLECRPDRAGAPLLPFDSTSPLSPLPPLYWSETAVG